VFIHAVEIFATNTKRPAVLSRRRTGYTTPAEVRDGDKFAIFESRISYKRYTVERSINQSINQRNFYSATYKQWTAALDNVNI